MKLWRQVSGVALSLALLACEKSDDIAAPYPTKILSFADGSYEVRTVEFKTLTSFEKAQGTLAEVKGGAKVNIDDNADEIIKTDNPDSLYEEAGAAVHVDYIVRDGVAYPKDFSSMASLGIYHNFERTFTFWTEFENISVENFLTDFGYTTIHSNPTISTSSGVFAGDVTIKVNAAFLPGIRDLWFFKQSRAAKVPLKLNFGVMAHEFSHSLFDLWVANKEPAFYDSEREFNRDVLSGLNEGLADFFSILVTGSESEFGESLSELEVSRTPPVGWTYVDYLDSCGRSFYCHGSVLNSALFESSARLGTEQVARYVVAAMKDFGPVWLDKRDDIDFDYDAFLNLLLDKASVVAEHQADLCSSFKIWFANLEKDLTC